MFDTYLKVKYFILLILDLHLSFRDLMNSRNCFGLRLFLLKFLRYFVVFVSLVKFEPMLPIEVRLMLML